jgi:phosphotransacetylase
MNMPFAPARTTLDATLYERYRGKARPLGVAVVWPCDPVSLRGAVLAAHRQIIAPTLIGPEERISEIAAGCGLDIEDIDVLNIQDPQEAAEAACAQVRAGHAQAIMKGSLHTNDLMSVIVARASGLRTERRMSHVFAIDHAHWPRAVLVTDAALNIDPDLRLKMDIVQNAIGFAHRLGIDDPRVAVLAAVETVEPGIESTEHAACLRVMYERGQIKGGIVDGPLALDNAVSLEAAEIKGLKGEVAGRADILMVPNYEAGNMLAKALEHMAHGHTGGLVLGAKVPIILTSRADSETARVFSCLLAVAAARGRI